MNAPHPTTASRFPQFSADAADAGVSHAGPGRLGWAERTAALLGPVVYDAPPAAVHPLADVRHPLAVALPDGYEPGYAYPLVLWLHDAGSDERALVPVMRGVSERNHLGVAVRGGRCGEPDRPLHGWDDDAVADLADRMPTLLEGISAEWTVHPRRIFLAGIGAGADAAAAVLAARPRLFAGAVLLGGGTLPGATASSGDGTLSGRRVLLGACGPDHRLTLPELRDAGRRYRDAGAEVTARVYPNESGGPDEPTPATLRHVDRWLMAGVLAAAA